MRPINSTEMPTLEFTPETERVKTKAPTAKIAWLHSISDGPGASFDLQIKDGLGRVKWEKKDCSSGSERFGILANIETLMGEDLEVCVTNVKGTKKLKVFLN